MVVSNNHACCLSNNVSHLIGTWFLIGMELNLLIAAESNAAVNFGYNVGTNGSPYELNMTWKPEGSLALQT